MHTKQKRKEELREEEEANEPMDKMELKSMDK